MLSILAEQSTNYLVGQSVHVTLLHDLHLHPPTTTTTHTHTQSDLMTFAAKCSNVKLFFRLLTKKILTCFKKRKKLGATEFIFEISHIIFSANFLRTFDDFVHFRDKLEIKQTSNVKLFFKLREDVQLTD